MARMREARVKPMRDYENENHTVNCGCYNKLWGL